MGDKIDSNGRVECVSSINCNFIKNGRKPLFVFVSFVINFQAPRQCLCPKVLKLTYKHAFLKWPHQILHSGAHGKQLGFGH